MADKFLFRRLLRKEIDENFRGRTFTRLDFDDLLSRSGSSKQALKDALLDFRQKGLLEQVGIDQALNVSNKPVIYRVVAGVELVPVPTPKKKRARGKLCNEIVTPDAYVNECQLALQAAIMRWR